MPTRQPRRSRFAARAARRRRRLSSRLGRIADWSFEHPKRTLLAWAVAIILVAAGAPALSGDFDSEYATPGTESHAASELLADRFPIEASGDTIDVVWQAPRGADAEPLEARIGCLVGEAERLDGVARAEAAQVSSGGDIGMVTLQLDRSADAVPAETLQCAPDLSYTAVTSKGSKEVGEFFAVGGC